VVVWRELYVVVAKGILPWLNVNQLMLSQLIHVWRELKDVRFATVITVLVKRWKNF